VTDLVVDRSGPLRGVVRVPGDKSISHRAVMISSVAEGATVIRGLLRSEDVLATLDAFKSMGIEAVDLEGGDIQIKGKGPDALESPGRPLDLGNSGTSMRLLAGLLSGLPVEVVLTGDRSLMRRPMGRVVEPLKMMGARILAGDKDTAPISIKGGGLSGISYRMPVASAQVKSALLLAGMSASGVTRVKEPAVTRDHTERMMPAFGVEVDKEGAWSSIRGGQKPRAAGEVRIPGDISSAAFFMVAALVAPGSEIRIENVGVNPTRTGVLDILKRMGADVTVEEKEAAGQEPVADIVVRGGRLRAVRVEGDLVPRSIDELPVVCVAAALAEGTTILRGAAELRVKESDRIHAMAAMLGSMGARVRELDDGLEIEGPAKLAGTEVDAGLDHRVAMAAAVAGLAASGRTVIRGAETIATSFPGFKESLTAAIS